MFQGVALRAFEWLQLEAMGCCWKHEKELQLEVTTRGLGDGIHRTVRGGWVEI